MQNNVMDEVLNTLEIVDNLIGQIVNEIESDNTDFVQIINLIDMLSLLSNKVVELANNDLDLDELTEKLNLLLNAIEEKDFILFSDLLQFQLKPLLEYWKETLE